MHVQEELMRQLSKIKDVPEPYVGDGSQRPTRKSAGAVLMPRISMGSKRLATSRTLFGPAAAIDGIVLADDHPHGWSGLAWW